MKKYRIVQGFKKGKNGTFALNNILYDYKEIYIKDIYIKIIA